jgi:hypothetical protein
MSTINLAGGNTLLSTGAFPPVRVASTGSPLTPATGGLLSVDGVTLAAGDRVLCKDEVSAVNNGIYAAQTGPWLRTSDASSNTQFLQGMTVTTGPQGAQNAGQTYVCTCTDDPVVVGTSLLTFSSQQNVQTQQQQATSTTSLTIGTGAQTLTIQTGKAFLAGQWVLIQETSTATNQMLGSVTSYTGSTLVVNVTATGSSGTHADWTIVLTNSAAAAGYQPPTGTGNVTGPGSSTTGHIATYADSSGKVLLDGGAPIGGTATITPAMFANAAMGYALGMLNGTLVASVAANALTVAVKNLAGNDPSSGDPVTFYISNGSGGWSVIKLTAALSLTVPSSATLGTVNAQAGRQWIAVFNNSSTPVLGIYNSLNSSTPSIAAWNEMLAVNGTGISSGSTSSQLWYTASSVTGKNFRVLGYIESTQTTAGTWAQTVTPYLYSPGVKRPGEPVTQVVSAVAGGSTSSSTYVSITSINISVQSAANLIRASAAFAMQEGSGGTVNAQLSRGTSAATNLFGNVAQSSGNASGIHTGALIGTDIPNTTGTVAYAVQAKADGTHSATIGLGAATVEIEATEIQI